MRNWNNTSGISLRQIAKELGVSHTLLSLWRQGKRKLAPQLEIGYKNSERVRGTSRKLIDLDLEIGAGRGNRTHTPITGQRILSSLLGVRQRPPQSAQVLAA